jgi:hypothetical protein
MERVICWDMDNTLGNFWQIHYRSLLEGSQRREAQAMINNLGPLSVRDGIPDLLGDLSERGYRHYLTTRATADVAIESLTKAGLKDYFDDIFYDRLICPSGRGKDYRPVIQAVGFNYEQAARRMLVIGDSPSDQPEIPNLVFIKQIDGLVYHATSLAQTIEFLEDQHSRSFNAAFMKVWKKSNILQPDWENSPRAFELERGLVLVLEDEKEFSRPALEIRASEEYKSSGILL